MIAPSRSRDGRRIRVGVATMEVSRNGSTISSSAGDRNPPVAAGAHRCFLMPIEALPRRSGTIYTQTAGPLPRRRGEIPRTAGIIASRHGSANVTPSPSDGRRGNAMSLFRSLRRSAVHAIAWAISTSPPRAVVVDFPAIRRGRLGAPRPCPTESSRLDELAGRLRLGSPRLSPHRMTPVTFRPLWSSVSATGITCWPCRPMFQVPVRFGPASFWCRADRPVTSARTAMQDAIVFVMPGRLQTGR